MPKKKTDEIVVINLAAHKTPVFKEQTGKDWILAGDGDTYFKYLLDNFYNSSKHSAIVRGKARFIFGGGWSEGGDTIVNSDGETLNSITRKTILDERIYGGYAIEVLWLKNGKAEYRHVNFGDIRSNADNTKFYYTKRWFNERGYRNSTPEKEPDFTIYDPIDIKKKGEKQLIYFKQYEPGIDVYPLPEYKAALTYIELEYQIANYWYNRVKNGFMPSAILNFYTKPTADEKKVLEEKIKAKFSGTENAGQFILNFAANKDFSADIQQITPPELGQEYEALNKTLQTEIMTGEGVTSGMLFGIKEAGQLGGRTELIEAFELMYGGFIKPKQDQTKETYSKLVFPFIGLKGDIHLTKMEPIGIDLIGNERAFNLLTDDEKRAAIGKDPIFKDKKSAEAEKIVVNINALPKELQSKAIDSLDRDEIRMIIGLKPSKEKNESKEEFSKAEKEAKLLLWLKSSAKKIKGEVLSKRPVTFEMSKNLKASEEEIRMSFAKKDSVTPTIIGKPIPKTIDRVLTEEIKVVYFYDWIDEIPVDERDTAEHPSREFCVELMAMSASGDRWERKDIDSLDNEQGGYVESVWESRGGWWNDGGINVPHCRHQWVQEVIREIK